MATVNPVPTLSLSGWVTSPVQRIDYLLVYYFTSDKLQTTVYRDKVSSLQWTLSAYPRDMDAAKDAVRREIYTYMSRYYDSVDVNVSWEDTSPDKSASQVTMTISMNVTLNGEIYNVGKVLTIVDGKMTEFADINNA